MFSFRHSKAIIPKKFSKLPLKWHWYQKKSIECIFERFQKKRTIFIKPTLIYCKMCLCASIFGLNPTDKLKFNNQILDTFKSLNPSLIMESISHKVLAPEP
jgi:hypothetical protein